ncbi:MAG TPA: trigger factor [Candidatus Lustribacter sp.]|nr:trigger factor [Candidatus Lustribacter sp.]
MKSALETLNPTRVKMTVEVPFSELKPSLDAAYKTIGSQIQVPGFRRGKVPARIIDQRVGRGAVMQEAVNEALPKLYGQAIEDNSVRPIGRPDVDVTEIPVEDGQELRFTVEVDVRPTLELPDFDGIAVEVDPAAASESDIEERLTELRERFGTLTTVERAAAQGDFVSIDLSASIDGEEIDTVSGVSYEVGSKNMLDGLDEAVVGMSAGQTTSFLAPLAGGEHEGADAECEVTVQSVKERVLPEVGDEFAQMASQFDTLDELRADLAAQAERAAKFAQGVQARDRILEHLLDTIEIPVPDAIVVAEVTSHLEGEDRLADDEHRAEVDANTRKALRSQFLLDAIVEKHEIGVEQNELIEYIVMSAQQYGMDPNTFMQAIDREGQIPSIVAEVSRRKALASVLEKATVTDTTGATVDLEAVQRPEAPAAQGPDAPAVQRPEAPAAEG